MELRQFLALECPLLLPHAGGGRPELRKAIEQFGPGDPGPMLWPGMSAGEAAGWTRDALLEALDGYYRREEIRESISADERRSIFGAMTLARELDLELKRLFMEKKESWNGYPSPQKGFRSLGQEACAALGVRLRRGREDGDAIGPMIRDLALFLLWTDDPVHVVLAQMGKKGTAVDGRDLHIGDLARGVVPPTAPLAGSTQTLVGMAYAAKLRREDRVFLSLIGEGGTSLGEWHEAVNFGSVQKLNLIFVVENNRWALGTHSTEQSAVRRFASKAAGYGIPGVTVFGNDPDEVAAAATWAAERARAGKGPTLLELMTYRRAGHAHHDDDRFHGAEGMKGYEVEEERRAWEAADPIALYRARLGERVAAEEETRARERAREAVRAAERAPWPDPGERRDPCFAPRESAGPAGGALPTRTMSYDEAVRQALVEAMERDPRVFVLGEDVGGRYGGAFGVTRGLVRQFGPARCLNTPISEGAILGCATGAALGGMRPVAEIQFADFVACGFNALVNTAAKVRWRWGRPVPMVVRLPYGGATGTLEKLLGGGPYHSQCPEAWFVRTPGLKVVAPSTPGDAKGLLTAALRDDNPVIYLEAKGLYGIFRPDLREAVPVGDFEVPLGKGKVRREGRDITLLTYGAMVYTALAAAELLEPDGISLEVVDLRSLVPLDEDLVLASVSKTHRAIVLHEDSKRGGVGAEIAAILAEKLIWELDGPIVRVAAPDEPAPYSPPLEYAYLPKPQDVVRAARALLER
ncbi:MAG TPA: dehydrogenase E1 component subunit alpha/beta [Planctomycetota bacterium]|nr:dehydrogenase E1 component subunit alpha/beta [Planctomycetota bacterium]